MGTRPRVWTPTGGDGGILYQNYLQPVYIVKRTRYLSHSALTQCNCSWRQPTTMAYQRCSDESHHCVTLSSQALARTPRFELKISPQFLLELWLNAILMLTGAGSARQSPILHDRFHPQKYASNVIEACKTHRDLGCIPCLLHELIAKFLLMQLWIKMDRLFNGHFMIICPFTRWRWKSWNGRTIRLDNNINSCIFNSHGWQVTRIHKILTFAKYNNTELPYISLHILILMVYTQVIQILLLNIASSPSWTNTSPFNFLFLRSFNSGSLLSQVSVLFSFIFRHLNY